VLFVSQRVLPAVALASGYKFEFPSLAPALNDLL
jgi:NAD dependent epimerase/dehydratase family enzyme